MALNPMSRRQRDPFFSGDVLASRSGNKAVRLLRHLAPYATESVFLRGSR